MGGAAAPKHFNLKIFLLNNRIENDLIYLKVNGIKGNDNYYLEVDGNGMIENIVFELKLDGVFDCILFELIMNIWICIKRNIKKIYWYFSKIENEKKYLMHFLMDFLID